MFSVVLLVEDYGGHSFTRLLGCLWMRGNLGCPAWKAGFSTACCAKPGETGGTNISPPQLHVYPVRVSVCLRLGQSIQRQAWWKRSEWCQEHCESVLPTLTLVLAPCIPYHCVKLAQPPSSGSRFVSVPSHITTAGNTRKPQGLYLPSFSLGYGLQSRAC